MRAPDTGSARAFLPELDTLRGLAAALMIANHAGVRVLAPAHASAGLSGALVFLGSFAPVVFFFATGFGIAVSSRRAERAGAAWWSVLWKAALLVVADQFFFRRAGHAFGLDFFGFIALATVLVTAIAGLRRAVPVAACIVVLLLVDRYALGPVLRRHDPDMGPWLGWAFGVRSVDDVSYPLSPWMAYPFIGFVLGRLYPNRPAARWRMLALAAGLVWLALSAVLWWQDAGFFRWGGVSFAYFVLSLAVLSGCAALAIDLSLRMPALAGRVALRGVASFAVIPLHYFMLDVVEWALPLPLPLPSVAYGALVVCLIPFSFWLAARFATAVSAPLAPTHRGPLIAAALAAVGALALATISLGPSAFMAVASLVVAAQLIVAAVLGLRAAR